MSVIAVDLGGTKLITALLSRRGKIVSEEKIPLGKRKGKQVGLLIRQETMKMLDIARDRKIQIAGIGICVPGIADAVNGKVWAPNIPGWTNYPLKKEMEEAFLSSGIKVEIDSDRSCYILGEVWKGNARGCSDAIYLSVGTGIGAGILVNHQVVRGKHGIAGAIGWMALEQAYRNEYDACGCFEYNASGEGIRKVAAGWRKTKKYRNSLLGRIPADDLNAAHVFAAADKKDELAVAVIDNAVQYWGMAVANLVSLFDPEKIIFGGGVFGPALPYLTDIYKVAKKWGQPVSMKKLIIEGSALGDKAGLLGAGYLIVMNSQNH